MSKRLLAALAALLFAPAAHAATTPPNPAFALGNAALNENVLDPRNPAFGAKCDGLTDDAIPLQLWATHLQYGQAGYIPAICLTSQPLVFPQYNGMTVYGNGLSSEIRYTGAAANINVLTFGVINGGCSISSLRLANFLLSSTTAMTAGDALVLRDACNVVVDGVAIEANAGGYIANWFQALEVTGGNQVKFDNYTFTASSTVVRIEGDGTTQLTDPRFGKGIITGGVFGVNIAGQVGGAVFDNAGILGNQTEMRISQDTIAQPNTQIFLLGGTELDVVSAGGLGIDLDIADPGSNNSILTMTGAWVVGATNQCFYIGAGTQWVINMTGGGVYNCGSDGIVNYSTSTIGNFVGVNIGRIAGYLGFTGYGLACDVADTNMHFEAINFISAFGTGMFNPYCQIASYASPGAPNMQSAAAYQNSSAPLTAWQFDVSGQAPTAIASGGNITLPVGGGRIIVNNNTNNDTGEYLCSAQRCVLVATTVGSFVTPTTSPASGKMSVQWNGVSNYDVYNNFGSAVNVTINMEKVRSIN